MKIVDLFRFNVINTFKNVDMGRFYVQFFWEILEPIKNNLIMDIQIQIKCLINIQFS